MGKDIRPIQIRFGDQRDLVRYEPVLDILFSENMPPRSRAFVVKELLLFAANSGVTLEDVLTGKIHNEAYSTPPVKTETANQQQENKEQPNQKKPKVSSSLAGMA